MKRMRVRWHQLAIGFVFLFTAISSWSADVPEIVHYEGYLTNKQGVALSDGNYALTFKMYDTATGGTALWSEAWPTMPVKDGRFRVLLGSKAPLTAAFFQQHPTTYLGITVGTETELLPRQRIASVPYALSAPGSAIPAGGIIMWSGALNTLPVGWALCDGSNGTPDLRNRFIVGSGADYNVGAKGGVSSLNVQHNHSINAEAPGTNNMGHHEHHISVDVYNQIGETVDKREEGDKDTGDDEHGHHLEFNTWGEGTHSHTVNSHSHGGATGNGGSTALENRPPYYALAFIMKL